MVNTVILKSLEKCMIIIIFFIIIVNFMIGKIPQNNLNIFEKFINYNLENIIKDFKHGSLLNCF